MITPENEEGGTRRKFEIKKEVLKLIATELVEFLVPICYLITYIFAFYGPNSTLIGSVKFSDWQYSSVEDIVSFSSNLMAMFTADLACLIISATFLFKLCLTNALQETYKLMKIFWIQIGMGIGGTMLHVIILVLLLLSIIHYSAIE